jgi:cytochrome c-type biogenesis protein CcmF
LIGWRGDQLRSPGRIDSPLSREGAFLANNLLFAVFAFVCLLGVTFPLVVESLRNDRISVGEPFFDRMTTPIGLALLFLMGVAPALPWRHTNTETLKQRLWWPAWTGVGALALAVVLGARGIEPLIAFGLGGFAAGAAFRQLFLATRRQGWRGLVGRANGGMVVHIGVIVIAVALAASRSYAHEGEFDLAQGESARVGGHELTYVGSRVVELPNRRELRARIQVDGGEVFEPRINQYLATAQEIGTPSVDLGWRRDVYMSLQRARTEADPTVGLRVIVQPMVQWLWFGGAVMLVGTAMAAFPGGRRNPLDPVSRPVGTATAGPPDDEDPVEAAGADEVLV